MTLTVPLPELNRRAFAALFDNLGPADALRFLRQYSQGHGDYQTMKDKMFEGKSVDDFFDEAVLHEDEKGTDATSTFP